MKCVMKCVMKCMVAALVIMGSFQVLEAAPVIETVFFDMPESLTPEVMPTPSAALLAIPGYPLDVERMTFIARIYLPDPLIHGPGPYPTVLFLHGSGGLWSNNTLPANLNPQNAPSSQFRDWGNLLVAEGFACLFPDSFHLRGITGSFEGKRPHHDPLQDDAACSPSYERPKDVVAALSYLVSRPDIDRDHIALIGFSHGAQTGMNALLDASADRVNYDVDYIDLVDDGNGGQDEIEIKLPVPGPVRIPDGLPIPKLCAFYYGGGSHYGYHGQASSTAAGRYMLDRRTSAILFHGTGDSLMGISNHSANPITGTVFPMKQVLASGAQAATLGLPNPIRRHYILNRCAVHSPLTSRVGHSFDLGSVTIAAPADWDTVNESPNQKARRLARQQVLRWIDFSLRPPPLVTIHRDSNMPNPFQIEWTTRTRLTYQLIKSTNLADDWNPAGAWSPGTGLLQQHLAPHGNRAFFKVAYQPQEAPVDEPVNDGFFLGYDDFGL
jgi:dienelactone hydrolase